MRSLLTALLDSLPYIGGLREELRQERARQGRYPGGHYYSPIPSQCDIASHLTSRDGGAGSQPEICLNREEQYELLQKYKRYYDEMPFPEKRQQNCRDYFDQTWFCYADAIALYCYLRHTTPARVVEVGSGFSSAVILDTVEQFLPTKPSITFVEPNAERLKSLLRADDSKYARLVEDKVQNAPMDLFTSLRQGDLLFIDSSHVLKAGNDLYFLMFEVLPRLSPGVFVHFHDVFYPFIYPAEWLTAGRYWNEAYFLRAFLAHNSQWCIHLFNAYAGMEFKDYLAGSMPLFLKNTGGSLYLRRK